MTRRQRRASERVVRMESLESVGGDVIRDPRPPTIPTNAIVDTYPSAPGQTWVRAWLPGRGYWAQETPESWDKRHGVTQPTNTTTETGGQTGGNGGQVQEPTGNDPDPIQNDPDPTPTETTTAPKGGSGLMWLGLLLLLLFATQKKHE